MMYMEEKLTESQIRNHNAYLKLAALIEKGTTQELSEEEKKEIQVSYLQLEKSSRRIFIYEKECIPILENCNYVGLDMKRLETQDEFYYAILEEIKTAYGADIPNKSIDNFYCNIFKKNIILNDEELFSFASEQIKQFIINVYIGRKFEEISKDKNRIIFENVPSRLLKRFVALCPSLTETSSIDNSQPSERRLKDLGFPFSKAVLYLSGAEEKFSPSELIQMLKESYPTEMEKYDNQSINEIYQSIMENTFQKIVSLSPLDKEQKVTFPELLEMELSQEEFEQLSNSILNAQDFNNIPKEYIKFFLVQIANQIARANNLPLHKVSIELINPKEGGLFLSERKETKLNSMHIKCGKKGIVNCIENTFHEERHYRQEMERNKLSINNLLYSIDRIFGEKHYENHYDDINSERDARRASRLQTYAFLRKYNKALAEEYKQMRIVGSDGYDHDYTHQEDKKNLKEAHIPQKDENLVQLFIENTSKEKIKEYQQEYPILTYITDENGAFYPPEEIIKRQEQSDKKENPEEYFFYENYLQLVTASRKYSEGVDSIIKQEPPQALASSEITAATLVEELYKQKQSPQDNSIKK